MQSQRQTISGLFLAAVPVVICSAVLLLMVSIKDAATKEKDTIGDDNRQPHTVAHLYFSDTDQVYLKAESRRFSNPGDPAVFGRAIILALIDGPRQGLLQTLPRKSTVRSFFVTRGRIAYVDFGKEIQENMPGGTQSEILAIYAIVNSLVLNISEIERVKILINGWESPTLDGHVDLRFPIKANMLLIR